MTKKLKEVATVLGLGLLLWYLVSRNLSVYGVYYYQHSSYTDKRGVPFVLVDHLEHYTGEYEVKRGKYNYDAEGRNRVSIEERRDGSYFFYMLSEYDSYVGYSLHADQDNQRKRYYFNKQFELNKITNTLGSPFPITDEERRYTDEVIETLTKELLPETKMPVLNLQWLYDMTLAKEYRERE